MPQQRGMKRAVKVATRKRKKAVRQNVAVLRRDERAEELAEKEAQAQKAKK